MKKNQKYLKVIIIIYIVDRSSKDPLKKNRLPPLFALERAPNIHCGAGFYSGSYFTNMSKSVPLISLYQAT